MSSDEDDYLSAKYLVDTPETAAPKTYSAIRKEVQKKGQIKHEQNRKRSRKERELEAREEGLSKSLFERAKEDEEAGIASGTNKALSIMMKMGFKPGQSLGNTGDEPAEKDGEQTSRDSLEPSFVGTSCGRGLGFTAASSSRSPEAAEQKVSGDEEPSRPHASHIKVPLPLNEWAGKRGIGLGKRARSPTAPERMAKMAKMAEDAKDGDYRSRARDEYNNRRAEGRLGPAQRTCATLDEQAGKEFNVLWLNPNNADSFPDGLIDALMLHSNLLLGLIKPPRQGDPTISTHANTEAQRLRLQMQADALQPLHGDEDDISGAARKTAVSAVDQYTSDILDEATQFLRLQAQDRLQLVLSYLREKYSYCFWCGIKYENDEDMEKECPGANEDDHD
ncbi:hypothetical protein D9611_002327 [Ephemerocybe angulata]|uniref:DUF4187 domain-containing protein n=1 Tax=Ephemerocybe angulata TaxID=980116 RepID=A0A8H5C1P5_9AGAR|nr:hypothetical protein D9611_002327 [Tulosesus angulatus]